MIGEKWLSDVIFTTVQSKADISRVKKGPNGDFQTGELSKAVNNDETNEITVKAWLSRAKERKSTLVFCVDLAHVSSLNAAFRRYGVDARFVTGDTPKKLRSERLDAFRLQKFPVLLNCGIFTEGTDIPNIDCVLLARPTKSRNLLVQMIGRGMRLHSGKLDCHVIDMVASLEAGIVTTPTLFGLDPAETVRETNVDQMKSLRERKELENDRERSVDEVNPTEMSETQLDGLQHKIAFTDYDSVYDLIDDTSAERHIRGISLLAWVLVSENRYVLACQSGEFLTIEMPTKQSATEQGLVRVWYTQKMPEKWYRPGKSPYLAPREVAKSETFSDAVHAADTIAKRKFAWRFIGHSQPWRKMPATESQLTFLNKYRDMDDQLIATQVTKGKATDMITKIRFGARGRFDKMKAAKKREDKVQNKISQVAELREREQVRVGPLQSTI